MENVSKCLFFNFSFILITIFFALNLKKTRRKSIKMLKLEELKRMHAVMLSEWSQWRNSDFNVIRELN